jgi:hypothetical protein
MNEVEYLLMQDAREKKAAGRGIYHKRSGSKTHYVGLPSDKMTAAEWKRRNGPIMSYNITKAIRSYDEFKALPTDLASEYVTNLQRVYNISMKDLAFSLGVKPSTLAEHIRTKQIRHSSKPGSRNQAATWCEFVSGLRTSTGEWIGEEPAAPVVKSLLIDKPMEESLPDPAPVETAAPDPAPVEETKPEPEAKATPCKATATKLRFSAGGTPEQLLDLIMTALADMTKPDRWYELDFSLRENGVVGGDE